MKKAVFTLTLASAVAAAMAPQVASARDFGDIYKECGLGAMLFPKEKDSTLAVITNVTWDLGTTAISSNISSPDTCQGGQAQKAAFIMETYPQLEKDLATGSGPHLKSLMAMSGCQQSVRADLGAALRNDFAKAVSVPGYSAQGRYEQAGGLFQLLETRIQSDFATSCTAG